MPPIDTMPPALPPVQPAMTNAAAASDVPRPSTSGSDASGPVRAHYSSNPGPTLPGSSSRHVLHRANHQRKQAPVSSGDPLVIAQEENAQAAFYKAQQAQFVGQLWMQEGQDWDNAANKASDASGNLVNAVTNPRL